MRRGGEIDEVERSKNHNKSKIRARVEHVFTVVKRLWGFAKVRYRGLAKNATRSSKSIGFREGWCGSYVQTPRLLVSSRCDSSLQRRAQNHLTLTVLHRTSNC